MIGYAALLPGLLLVVGALAVPPHHLHLQEWQEYKASHHKHYPDPEEDRTRMKLFLECKAKVRDHNLRHDRGETSYRMGVNKFCDWTPEELDRLLGTRAGPLTAATGATKTFQAPPDFEVPESVNWTQAGAVTPVKNQGKCECSWAFSATGAMEGLHFIKYKQLVSLSEQNLVDCSRDEGNEGCDGGDIILAFQYLMKNRGINSEADYPYEEKAGYCRYKEDVPAANLTNYVVIARGDEKALQAAVASAGPVSVAIYANPDFVLYKSGIFDEIKCPSIHLNQGMLVVGYNAAAAVPYWTMKNSWGDAWGEGGYVRMKFGKNLCGLANAASYPTM